MSGIFVNYRREDSGGEAAHLRDDLVERFGEDNVFFVVSTVIFVVIFVAVLAFILSGARTVLGG